METLKALLIDDDKKLGDLLKDFLQQHSIDLISETDPLQGTQRIQKKNPDLLILDVMMPNKDGFTLCKEIRSKEINLPIIMLTARGDTVDRVVGLELGADDYVPKPFEPRELAARIRSVHRRYANQQSNNRPIKKFEDLEINTSKRTALLNGADLDLSTAEFELLKLLTTNPGRKFTRDEITNHMNGVDADVYSRSVDILISRIRTKLGDNAKSAKYIKTVWGTGYSFIGKATDV